MARSYRDNTCLYYRSITEKAETNGNFCNASVVSVFFRNKIFLSVILLACFQLSIFNSVQAQQPTRHNCWDIDLPAPDPELRNIPSAQSTLPSYYVLSRADSGLMVVALAKEYLGTPYHYGGRTPKGFDCAGFARYIYLHFGHELPGWSGAQAKLGVEVSDTRNLLPGDLVFFGGRHSHKTVGHTGIAIQTDTVTGVFTFIHSATHGGVIISRSTEPYYKERYLTARRLFK